MYATSFTVEGKLAFPLDMLRYDTCHPTHQQDVGVIVDSMERPSRQPNTVYRVGLTQYHSMKQPRITMDRWSSFGWVVMARSTHTAKV